MTGVVLHDYWRSSASYRVRIALGLKGIAFRSAPVDLLKAEHRAPAHLARNPQGLLPALEIDGQVLTQSLAILEYLEETRPDPALLPAAPAARARIRALCHAVAMEIAPVCNVSVLAAALEVEGVAPEAGAAAGHAARVAWMARFIPKGLAAVEAMLDHPDAGAFAHGDAPGMFEAVLTPQLYNARRWEIALPPLPRIEAIAAACAALPAFQAAHPDAVHAAEAPGAA